MASTTKLKEIITRASSPFARVMATQSPFVKSFRDGPLGGTFLFLLLFVWMFLRANDTARKMQDLASAKSVVIEEKIVEHAQSAADPSAPSQKKLPGGRAIEPLPPAPIDGLMENVEGRMLPMARISDDLTPFDAYKKPYKPVAGRPQVSFVVLDFGLSAKLAQSLLDNTPAELSLVLSPYSDDAEKWAAAARAYGHEFWLSLPMQTADGSAADTGPDTLMTNASLDVNQARILNTLASAVGYAGVVTTQSHAFANDSIAASPILKQIFGRGLAMAESNPDIAAFGLSQAMENGHPYVQNNFWLDSDLRAASIDATLRAVELQATRKGKAIVFLRPYPVVMKQLYAWLEQADDKGIQIAPLSAMVP